MACGRQGCEKEPTDGRYYCSKSCAQLDDLPPGAAKPTPSTSPKERSTTKGVGERSHRSLFGEKRERREHAERPEIPNAEPSNEPTRIETERSVLRLPDGVEIDGRKLVGRPTISEKPNGADETESGTERLGTPGMQGTGLSRTERRSSDESEETQLTDSSTSRTRLEEARFHTMSMIDESALLLLDCMRSASKKNNGEMRDFRDLNAVANVGKQIGYLARTKLDAIKEARKNG